MGRIEDLGAGVDGRTHAPAGDQHLPRSQPQHRVSEARVRHVGDGAPRRIDDDRMRQPRRVEPRRQASFTRTERSDVDGQRAGVPRRVPRQERSSTEPRAPFDVEELDHAFPHLDPLDPGPETQLPRERSRGARAREHTQLLDLAAVEEHQRIGVRRHRGVRDDAGALLTRAIENVLRHDVDPDHRRPLDPQRAGHRARQTRGHRHPRGARDTTKSIVRSALQRSRRRHPTCGGRDRSGDREPPRLRSFGRGADALSSTARRQQTPERQRDA